MSSELSLTQAQQHNTGASNPPQSAAVLSKARETISAQDVHDASKLDARHSELVTVSFHPSLSLQPLGAGSMSWNAGIERNSAVAVVKRKQGGNKSSSEVSIDVKRLTDDELYNLLN